VEARKPAPLKALTGLRCFAAINIVLFHFSNPQWFNFNFYFHVPFTAHTLHIPLLLAPIVNAGFISVSYFILLSGFVLGYNYNARAREGELDRKRFWEARRSTTALKLRTFSVLISPDSCPLTLRARGIFSLRFSGSPLRSLLRAFSLLP